MSTKQTEKELIELMIRSLDNEGGYSDLLDEIQRLRAVEAEHSAQVDKLTAELEVANGVVAELQRDAVITMQERDELYKFSKRLTAGILAVGELISESSGVSGLHRNGDQARWDELLSGGRFEGWLRDFSESEMAIAEQVAAKLRAKVEP